MARKKSYLTGTDQFCGAGGSSIGATRAGIDVRLAMNHWKLAIDTHNTNFPNTDHDCTDVSAADPRRYPSTDFLITSPECTTHSPAGGNRRSKPQRDLLLPSDDDASVTRSRATAWDVPRFAEYHDYRIIIVENVIQFAKWMLFPEWLATMAKLGYAHRIVSLNSMFCHPTPQSRDRIYIVFWKVGNRAPNLGFTEAAWCPKCERIVQAVQHWKPARTFGIYRQQYVYGCPTCQTHVKPYYFAALNALDLSIPAERIGDRKRALKPRTMERIRFGLEKYGRTALVVRTNMTTDGGRVRPLDREMHAQTASWLDALAIPPGFTVETAYTNSERRRARGFDEPLASQGSQSSAALVYLPFLITAGSNPTEARAVDEAGPTLTGSERIGVVQPFMVNTHIGRRVYGLDEAISSQCASREHDGLVIPPAALIANRAHNTPRSLADAVPTIATGGHQMLIQGAALLTLRDTRANRMVRGLDDPLPSQVASGTQDWVMGPTPFLVSQYGTAQGGRSVDGAMPAVTTLDRHALVEHDGAALDPDDCYFRMLQPNEIGRAMAFPDSYRVLGTKRDQVKQYGNAVTPPAMDRLIKACVESLVA